MQTSSIVFVILSLWVSDCYAEKNLKNEEILVCVKWKWVEINGVKQVACLSWQVRDCSKRLYKEICKLEGKK